MRKTGVMFFFILLAFEGKTQTIDVFDEIMTRKIQSEVKQLGQFFRRFNMEDTVPLSANVQPSRFTNILSLFNFKNKDFTKDSSVILFINDVIAQNKKLSYTDSNWCAVAHASFIMAGKKISVPIYLQFIEQPKKKYSWVIDSIDPAQLNISFARNERSFIDPVNNELNFIEISKALDRKQNLISYTRSNYALDYLSVFLYMAHTGIIKFNQIDSVTYQFKPLPQWEFTVSYFNRIDNNSGWLIANLRYTDTKNNFNNHK